MKKMLGFVAMVLAIAACNTMEMDNQPAEKDEMITITAQLAPKTAMTKALASGKDAGDNDIIVSTWAVGEHLAILYKVKKGETTYDYLSADAVITAVDGSGAAAIEFSLDARTPDGTDCKIVYPYSAKQDGDVNVKGSDLLLNAQNGKLNATENPYLDVRVGAGVIHISPASLDVTTQPAVLFSIFEFTIQDLAGNAKVPSKFKVIDANDTEIASFTPNTTSNILYVALPAMDAGTYWFNATADGKPYVAKATISNATATGMYYQTMMKMATLGNVIASDGKFYVNNAETPQGDSAVAMISYLGYSTSEAKPYKHGLALALRDASSTVVVWMTPSADAGHTKQSTPGISFTTESGLQYNDDTHNSSSYPAFQAAISNNGTAKPSSGCTDWFLPSGCQWYNMINACTVLNYNHDHKCLRDAFEAVGGTNMNSSGYWSCSEKTNSSAWYISFSDGTWYTSNKGSEGNAKYVRSALAF